MNYKMICIDLDGTLLGKNRSISYKTKEAIKLVQDKGIKVIITTGRLYINALQILEELGIDTPIIATNGAIIRDENKKIDIYKKNISFDKCSELLELMKKYKITAHFYTENEVISNNLLGIILGVLYSLKNKHKKHKILIGFSFNRRTSMKKLKKNENNILKCIAYSNSKENLSLFKDELKKVSDIEVYGAGRRSIEINSSKVSKGNSVKVLAEYLNIKKEDIICIGDNENDISMIKFAGLGIAMKNAIPKLKELADYITDTNMNEGVEKAIRKFVL